MKNTGAFGSRKGGATIRGKFYLVTTSGILAKQLERYSRKMEYREMKRQR